MRTLIAITILALAAPTYASECWQVGNMKGMSARMSDNLEISADGFSGQSFDLVFDRDNSRLGGHSDMACSQYGQRTLVCLDAYPSKFVMETWTVDIAAGMALHTKLRDGYGMLDGANLFVGEILGACTP